ncbi:MAG: hypothetical protein J6I84_03510 [Bacilli bacterium]|nr:hypothetical protein [Bacilli bacterium]
MKIEVTLGSNTREGYELINIIIRIPPEVKEISGSSIQKLLKKRNQRISTANYYIQEYNMKHLFKKKLLTNETAGYHYLSWSPIIPVDKLKFIIEDL